MIKAYIVISTWTTVLAAAWLSVFGFPTIWLALAGLLVVFLIWIGSPRQDVSEITDKKVVPKKHEDVKREV